MTEASSRTIWRKVLERGELAEGRVKPVTCEPGFDDGVETSLVEVITDPELV